MRAPGFVGLVGMMAVAAALTFVAAIWFVKTRKTGDKELKN